MRHILYLVCLNPCIRLRLIYAVLCDLFFIFSLTFIVINNIPSLKQVPLFFVHLLEYLQFFLNDNLDEESE